MRTLITTVAVSAILGLAGTVSAQATKAPKLGSDQARPAAATPKKDAKTAANAKIAGMIGDTLVDIDGKKHETAKVLEGRKNVVIYFTASWCGPCRRFTPDLVKFANETKDAKDFVIIMVGSDRNAKAQDDYMKKAKMPFFAVPFGAPGVTAIKQAYAGRGIPNLVVLDDQGNAVKGSYETDGRYSPENRNSYIGPQPVLASFKKMRTDAAKKGQKG